jgi:hypothetical protein
MKLLLKPLLLLTGLTRIELLPFGVTRHVTGSRARLLHGLVAGPILVSLLRRGLIAKLLASPILRADLFLILRLASRLTLSLVRPSLSSLLTATSLSLALALTAATTALCPDERWGERKGNG